MSAVIDATVSPTLPGTFNPDYAAKYFWRVFFGGGRSKGTKGPARRIQRRKPQRRNVNPAALEYLSTWVIPDLVQTAFLAFWCSRKPRRNGKPRTVLDTRGACRHAIQSLWRRERANVLKTATDIHTSFVADLRADLPAMLADLLNPADTAELSTAIRYFASGSKRADVASALGRSRKYVTTMLIPRLQALPFLTYAERDTDTVPQRPTASIGQRTGTAASMAERHPQCQPFTGGPFGKFLRWR